MQVEVKALLDGLGSYQRVMSALEPQFVGQDLQENHFLDTAAREFFAQGTILRVRLLMQNHHNTGTPQQAVAQQHASANPANYSGAKLMVKEHAHVEDGSQVSWTAEENIPVDTALQILRTPRQIYVLLAAAQLPSETILTRLEKEYPREHLAALEYVGCFSTLRTSFGFSQAQAQAGLTIRVDKTTYPFGDRYEVEIPNITVPVQDVADDLSTFLSAQGAVFEFAEESKFQRFAHGIQASKSSSHMVQEVKVVLATEADVQKVCASLEGSILSQKMQDNTFYDGFDDELASRGAFFRLRRVNGNKFSGVLKEHQDVDSGSQLNWTQEVELSPDVAHGIMHDPTGFLSLYENNTLANALKQKFKITRLRTIGGFSTQRTVFAWPNASSQPQGLEVRVDVTHFPFGDHYEVEVGNIVVPVSDVLNELEGVLRGLGVAYRVATESKLDCFLRGCSR